MQVVVWATLSDHGGQGMLTRATICGIIGKSYHPALAG
jgi:hypothetical protein